ncbi:MAG: DUF559 domain-containing protein, partial [Saprospiraceae bacterium]
KEELLAKEILLDNTKKSQNFISEENDSDLTTDMFYGAKPNIFERAASLRRNMTVEELKVWNYLKTKPSGLKFRRQHPIMFYVVDFYCHSIKLVIEIDGINHKYSSEADSNREEDIIKYGIKIIRFTNKEVNSNFEFIIESTLKEIQYLQNITTNFPKSK